MMKAYLSLSYHRYIVRAFFVALLIGSVSLSNAIAFDVSSLSEESLAQRTQEVKATLRASEIAHHIGSFLYTHKYALMASSLALYSVYNTRLVSITPSLPLVYPCIRILVGCAHRLNALHTFCSSWWPDGLLGNLASTFTVNALIIPAVAYCIQKITPLTLEQFVNHHTRLRILMHTIKQEAAILDPHSPILILPDQINITINGMAAGDHRNRFVQVTMRNIDDLLGLKAYTRAHQAVSNASDTTSQELYDLCQELINEVSLLIAFVRYSQGNEEAITLFIEKTKRFSDDFHHALDHLHLNNVPEQSSGILSLIVDYWRILETFIVTNSTHA